MSLFDFNLVLSDDEDLIMDRFLSGVKSRSHSDNASPIPGIFLDHNTTYSTSQQSINHANGLLLDDDTPSHYSGIERVRSSPALLFQLATQRNTAHAIPAGGGGCGGCFPGASATDPTALAAKVRRRKKKNPQKGVPADAISSSSAAMGVQTTANDDEKENRGYRFSLQSRISSLYHKLDPYDYLERLRSSSTLFSQKIVETKEDIAPTTSTPAPSQVLSHETLEPFLSSADDDSSSSDSGDDEDSGVSDVDASNDASNNDKDKIDAALAPQMVLEGARGILVDDKEYQMVEAPYAASACCSPSTHSNPEDVSLYFKKASFLYDTRYRQFSTLERVANWIRSKKPLRIVVLCGAGISTSCGIPDFRSPNSGVYAQLEKYNLPYPEAIFSLDYFRQNPAPFYSVFRHLHSEDFTPSLTHYFLRLLEAKNLLLRTYTQNVDGLEEKAGLSLGSVIYSHGSPTLAHCTGCRMEYSRRWLDTVLTSSPTAIPTCAGCGGYVKPNITLFGENLPSEFAQNLYQDFMECDMMLILGTSLSVSPFNLLPSYTRTGCPRLMINLTCPHRDIFDYASSVDKNSENLFYQGDCDDATLKLATLLGWRDELVKLTSSSKRAAIIHTTHHH